MYLYLRIGRAVFGIFSPGLTRNDEMRLHFEVLARDSHFLVHLHPQPSQESSAAPMLMIPCASKLETQMIYASCQCTSERHGVVLPGEIRAVRSFLDSSLAPDLFLASPPQRLFRPQGD
jgi:hypothetical protein